MKKLIGAGVGLRRSLKAARCLVVACLLVVVAAVLTVYLGYAVRVAAVRKSREHNMERIVQAIRNRHRQDGFLRSPIHRDRFGNPVCSWRYPLLEWIEQSECRRCYDVPWTDPVNFELANTPYRVYCFPSADDVENPLQTNVCLVTGPGTVFDGRRWSLEDIDGDTILIVEVARSGVHWMEPGDLDINAIPPSITAGLDGKGLHVGFADGNVWYLDAGVPLEHLKSFFTVEGARRLDREEVLGPHRVR